jgi:Rieske Fe-S protein
MQDNTITPVPTISAPCAECLKRAESAETKAHTNAETNAQTNTRREFVRGAAILAAAAQLAPSELLSAALQAPLGGGDKKTGELADFFTVNFSAFPALQNVNGSIRLNTANIPGASGLRNIIITRISATEFAAVSEECTHESCSVGTFNGSALSCPCHGSRFDARGNVLTGPAGSPLTRYDTSFTAGESFMRVNIPGFTAPPPPMPIILPSVTTLAFGQVMAGASNTQQYTITASNLTAALVVTAPQGVSIGLSQTGTFDQTLTLQPSNGQIPQTTIFVRFAPTAATTLTGSITHLSGTILARVTLSGTGVAPQPSLTLSATTLALGRVLIGQTVIQSYTLTASNLGSTLMVVAPAGLTLATSQNGPFSTSLMLQPTGGQLSQTVFVRFAPTAAITLMAGINHLVGTSSLGVVNVTASVSAVALMFSVPALQFSGVATGATAVQQYGLRGTDISGTLQITAPQGFTLAQQMAGPFQQTLNIIATSNGVIDTPIFVRFAPTQVGTTEGEIRHTFGDQTLGTVRVSGTATMTSVNDNRLNMTLQAYPNPVMETLFVAITLEAAATLEMKLVNVLGQEVVRVREQVAAGRHFTSMQVGHLGTGAYTLRVGTGDAVAEKRVMKR